MKFYEFNQNNSGGSFTVNEHLCHRLFIEAENEQAAINKAEVLGVYFNGVDEGYDCSCCGDRWYKPTELSFPNEYSSFTEDKALKLADKYGCYTSASKKKFGDRDTNLVFDNVEQYAQYLADEYGWTIPECRIYYVEDDKVVEIFKEERNELD